MNMSWDSCVPPCPGNLRWDSWGVVWNVSICLGVRGGREAHSRSELVFVDLPPFKKPRNRFRGIDFAINNNKYIINVYKYRLSLVGGGERRPL